MISNRQHIHYPEVFPLSWATGWGEDEFGLWMAFSYKDQRQQFRWCEPGSFLIGSPKDEPERVKSETQREITFSKGFWIADTTVTQGLWEAVMDGNPSRFKGVDRPVDSVSWNEAKSFIGLVARMNPTLNLCLPSEAQWEYACRAGSTTPFCWGEQINSELVNFRGGAPYKNGLESEYRKSTVDVKAFHRNNWGLWQMHGNVWEWCQDRYGDVRALRGGSWFNFGGRCRSAINNRRPPDYRLNRIGFRLALSHE